ncbi:hypothetical protein [Candidatus Stoquefichus massiliensis]|uniref:hypothetical protein n=1 Tax=Candidatus Stoquefichus massiliensis TaxID=1470350 RepID=UPI000480BFFC|nr:hypothetical protein [Candidatus Stoquefichus massiliensis]
MFFKDGQNLSEEEMDQRCRDIVTNILESSDSDLESGIKFMQIERDVRYINTELDKAKREGYQIGLEERLKELDKMLCET